MPLRLSPLAAASSAALIPARAAIADRVSPGRTTYAPEGAVDDVETAPLVPTSSLSLSPSPPEPREAFTPDAFVNEDDVCGGIITVDPAMRCASADRPLAAASCATLRPSAAATEYRDSPGTTVWAKAAEAA